MNLFNDIKEKKKSLKKKIMYCCLLLIPFISILLVVMFRHTCVPTTEEILEDLKNSNNYNSILEYTITNPRGEYKQKANLNCCESEGIRIDFGSELTKIYKDDKIIMKYHKKGEEYEVGRELDMVYPMAAMGEIFKNEIESVEEGQEEWGDLKYIKVDFKLAGNNKHLAKATLYIDKNNKTPILMKIYDDKGEERVRIDYREFSFS